MKKEGIFELKERIAALKEAGSEKRIIGDKLKSGDFVVLVVPIDSAAPKGRLILPQQQTIRDILDAGAIAIVTRESELAETLEGLGKKPAMVITDSQVFKTVAPLVPKDIILTSFSILFARHKGLLDVAAPGAAEVERLKDGDTVLIAEGCTHHRQCDDIGTVKIPRWLRQYSGKDIQIETCSGTEFPEDLTKYAMVVHCGGCMLNERDVRYRTKCAVDQGVPITNYGTFIAYVNGILKRSLEVFPEILEQLENLIIFRRGHYAYPFGKELELIRYLRYDRPAASPVGCDILDVQSIYRTGDGLYFCLAIHAFKSANNSSKSV